MSEERLSAAGSPYGDADSTTQASPAASVSNDVAALLAAAAAYARRVAELAAAETRLAASSAVAMLALAIVAAALLIVGWVFAAAVVAYLLVLLGLPWAIAGLVVAALHAVAAFLLFRIILRLSRSLTWPELRRTLLGGAEE